jgi:hypothetical protein
MGISKEKSDSSFYSRSWTYATTTSSTITSAQDVRQKTLSSYCSVHYGNEINLGKTSDLSFEQITVPSLLAMPSSQPAKSLKLEHERIPPKTPNKNAHIESFHAVLEDECLRRSEFATFAEAHETVMEYINFYNERRIHGSLYDLSPKQFRETLRTGHVQPLVVKL